MSTRARRKAETRQRILDAALDLLVSGRGLDALGLREVARAAGLAPPSLYSHFSDMDDIGLALVDLACYRLRTVMRERRQEVLPGDPADVIRDIVQRFDRYLTEHEAEFRLLVQQRLGTSRRYRQRIHRELQLLVDDVQEDARTVAAARGLPDMDTAAASEAAVSIMFGFGIQAVELAPGQRHEAMERAVTGLAMVFLGGRALAANARVGDRLKVDRSPT